MCAVLLLKVADRPLLLFKNGIVEIRETVDQEEETN
jgi:hypothetical protein